MKTSDAIAYANQVHINANYLRVHARYCYVTTDTESYYVRTSHIHPTVYLHYSYLFHPGTKPHTLGPDDYLDQMVPHLQWDEVPIEAVERTRRMLNIPDCEPNKEMTI